MLIVQVTTIFTRMNIEGARWEVNMPWLQEGHSISLDMLVKDPDLIKYVEEKGGNECSIDKEGDKFRVSLSCMVTKIRHMIRVLDDGTPSTESLAIVTPANRLVEGVMTYAISPSTCDPKFINAVRGTSQQPNEKKKS
jgi:hypothetical protein